MVQDCCLAADVYGTWTFNTIHKLQPVSQFVISYILTLSPTKDRPSKLSFILMISDQFLFYFFIFSIFNIQLFSSFNYPHETSWWVRIIKPFITYFSIKELNPLLYIFCQFLFCIYGHFLLQQWQPRHAYTIEDP